MAPVVFVTGATRGIGLAIIDRLSREGATAVLGYRKKSDADEALKTLSGNGVDTSSVIPIEIDVESDASVAQAVDAVKKTSGLDGGIDVLINNAGYAISGSRFDGEVAGKTIGVNYFGVRRVTDAFLPLLRPGGRIIVISSGMGTLDHLPADGKLYQRFTDPKASISDADALMSEFIRCATEGSCEANGWPENTYSNSKIGVNMYCRALQRRLDAEKADVFLASVCPGWCQTRMGSDRAPRSADKGAETPVWLSLTDLRRKPSGQFWRDKKQISW